MIHAAIKNSNFEIWELFAFCFTGLGNSASGFEFFLHQSRRSKF